MSIVKTKILGEMDGGGSESVTVESITDATEVGKDVLLAKDAPAVLAIINALGKTGSQKLDGALTITNGLTLTLPDSQVSEWATLIFMPRPDGSSGASLDYLKWTGDATFLRLSIRMPDDIFRDIIQIQPVPGPDGQLGGIQINPSSYLRVNNFYLDRVSDTGYAVFTAVDEAAAREAIGAGTSNLELGTTSTTAKAGDYQPTVADLSDATPFGQQLLQCEDAAAVKALLGITG